MIQNYKPHYKELPPPPDTTQSKQQSGLKTLHVATPSFYHWTHSKLKTIFREKYNTDTFPKSIQRYKSFLTLSSFIYL